MNKTGVELIAEERKRQIEVKGWTQEHDTSHDGGELAVAAASYACHPMKIYSKDELATKTTYTRLLPFDEKDRFKQNEIRNLVIAGALIAAEIDRLQNQ